MLGLKAHASVLNALNNTFYDAMYEIKFKNYYDKLRRQLNSEPSLQRENEQLKIQVRELTELIEFYRKKTEHSGIFG